MRRQRGGIPTILFLILVMAVFIGTLVANSSPAAPIAPLLPTAVPPTESGNAWQIFLTEDFGGNSTPLPTIAIPTQAFIAPTLASDPAASPTSFAAIEAGEVGAPQVASGATPTRPPPTIANVDSDDDTEVTAQAVTRSPSVWQPPPLIPPLSRDPLGRDHYWFTRPVDSDANNAVLFFYPFGSDGPEKNNPLRVHHGIDMPNPVGEAVRAAGSGKVVWAADGRQEESGIFQNSPSYGNVIVIEHDFGYRGQPVYTLYAHLSVSLVEAGQDVVSGEVIGLIGDSGRVSGPHVHFEVRVGENAYRATFNPVLWMVPYVGHGVIVGRVADGDGVLLPDMDITVRNRENGLVQDTTTSYVALDTGFDINADPIWQENFAIADVPAGRYDVIVTINGQRIIRQVNVVEGTTSFVELIPLQPATVEAEVTEESGG